MEGLGHRLLFLVQVHLNHTLSSPSSVKGEKLTQRFNHKFSVMYQTKCPWFEEKKEKRMPSISFIKTCSQFFFFSFFSFLFVFYFILFGFIRSYLQHEGSLVSAWEHLTVACGIQLPDQGSSRDPLRWGCGVSATGPLGKSLVSVLDQGDEPF